MHIHLLFSMYFLYVIFICNFFVIAYICNFFSEYILICCIPAPMHDRKISKITSSQVVVSSVQRFLQALEFSIVKLSVIIILYDSKDYTFTVIVYGRFIQLIFFSNEADSFFSWSKSMNETSL